MAFEFLSDEWIDAMEALQADAPEPPAALQDLVVNLVVTDSPFGDREARLASGRFERGLVDDAPTKLTIPYDVAKAVFVDQDPTAAMQAFMSGKIKVEGDMTKLMAMQAAGAAPSEAQQEYQRKVRELTA